MSDRQSSGVRRHSNMAGDVSPQMNDSAASTSPIMDMPREGTDNASVPKPKRLACMICRKRKLKCDGIKPSCSTCARLGHSCAYDEVRRKSGPKRGYVKALEERLKQVETLLNKTQDASPTAIDTANPAAPVPMAMDSNPSSHMSTTPMGANLAVPNPAIAINGERDLDHSWHLNGESPQQGASLDDFNFNSSIPFGLNNVGNNFTWEMIGLGLEEPLPPQETIDELHQIFFEKVHPSIPMIQKYRYLAAMNLAPNQRPPVALRYAIWTLACSITDKYIDLKDLFYQRARKYVEADYVKGYGEHMISVAHAQTHILLASYEFKMMYFPRGWMSTGAAVRLCHMIGLHRLDGAGLDVKQSLPPPRDWTEREERRRTFWMAFCEDRYASIGTGWPMMIDEKDIMTNLPASDEAFDMSRPEQTQTLQACMTSSGAGKLSSFGGIVLMACLFGRNLLHLHRPDVDERDHDLNGEFWKRHRVLDNILLNTSLCLPPHIKLPEGRGDPNIVFTNMSIHTSTICLHQAAIFKADKNKLPATVSTESKVRCISAANEITSIMKMISHMDLSTMNPFISFCLYVAARVFVQYLKSRPSDTQTTDSLQFLLTAMNALKRKNPLTESFLVQLDVDLEALIARIPSLQNAFPKNNDSITLQPADPIEPAADTTTNSAPGMDRNVRQTYADQWLHADTGVPAQDSILTPSSGSMYEKPANGLGQSETSGENNGSADGDQSGRPTPSSSSTSEHRAGIANGMDDSRRGPYDTSGVMGGQTVLMDAQGTGYLANGREYGLGISEMAARQYGMGETNDGFGMAPGGWQGMSGQPGVLRSLTGMEPLDAMDLTIDGQRNDGSHGDAQYGSIAFR
ncbi:fungal-specific transcription factor domain-containing protein [Plectosphaerella plurivora]|uniref:Fungal-specific transcription factor domain-containing protein n=1 Tax=Plectosphaerella plurivora TaxID=936078 RepID=A0A9P9A9J7_9PEZI|nr:fungal-specific transcription factor domain-containing protein [Plectosphaerella plurivora]